MKVIILPPALIIAACVATATGVIQGDIKSAKIDEVWPVIEECAKRQ